jgi:hypothetical protein
VEWVTSPEIVEYPRRARWILDLQEVFGVGENGALGIREPVQQPPVCLFEAWMKRGAHFAEHDENRLANLSVPALDTEATKSPA